MSNREVDINGYITIKKNPISKVGVFPYLGKNIDPALDPEKIYWVYRPAEELSKPETLESFRHIPIVDDHTMLGAGQTPAERKGVEGVTGGNVTQEGDYLYADLHIYSDTLKQKIDANKKDLSIGYRVGNWEKANGLFNGVPYDYIQRNLLGNHVALVKEGRSGPDVSVLDHKITYDHMDIVEDGSQEDRIKRLEENVRRDEERVVRSNGAERDDAEKILAETKRALKTAKANVKDTAADATSPPTAACDGGGENKQAKEGNDTMADDPEKKEDKKIGMDEVKAFMKEHAKDRKAFDKLMDEMRPEEKKAEDADTTEKPGDQKAEDAEEEKKDDKKAEDKAVTDAAIAGLTKEVADLKKNGIKALMGELNKRNEVAKTVEAQFGTFDHAELTAAEVAAYGLKKAGISAPAGSEIAVWDAYATGRKASGGQVKTATDTKDKQAPVGSLIEKSLAASK